MMQTDQRGFTLLEIMVVLVIISIIAALIVPNILSRPDDARKIVTRNDIQSVSNALSLYKLDNYTFPSTEQGLEALVKKPDGEPAAPNWKADGYLQKTPVDPWGNAYQYLSPGVHGEYDLWSFGPHGKKSDNTQFIGNWQ
jgi:general secretion pathway protein G